jgi:hypothetical protein
MAVYCNTNNIYIRVLRGQNARFLVVNLMYIYIYIYFLMARQPLGSQERLSFRGFTITHFLDTPHSVGLLWTSDQPVAETST